MDMVTPGLSYTPWYYYLCNWYRSFDNSIKRNIYFQFAQQYG